MLLEVCEPLEELEELEPELNEERDEEDDELPAVPTRTASIAFGLGLGRPSVRLAPKCGGP